MEMENKKRPSLDSVGSGSSALRRLTRTPGHRLGLRRSSSESSRSSVSLASEDSEASQSACVSRDTVRYECGLHRFIVWSACKRNACEKMTPEEKRECPLLRCRRRFPNHELMLQHLYECEQLARGEYWCYECERVEHFNDSKCKRCLGHPSRRKRIISMAKNLFSSLGPKSKTSTLIDLDLDLDDDPPPPSYDAVLVPSQVELQANEIHEIDSLELPLTTILEDEDEAADPGPPPLARPAATLLHRAELESAPTLTDSLLSWGSSQPTIDPSNLLEKRGPFRSSERPALQVFTSGLEHYRAQAKRRSKMLAPSSSVRSTASTASTNSTNSTSSTASYNISPMSSWSGAWAKGPGFASTLTSPADGSLSPGGLLSTNPFTTSCKAVFDDDVVVDKDASDPFLLELPADIPMLDALPSTDPIHDPLHDHLTLYQSVLSTTDPLLPPEPPSTEAKTTLTENLLMASEMSGLHSGPAAGSYTKPQSLVGTTWDALKTHVTATMEKLQHTSKSHLVTQLRNMSTSSIAVSGLEVLNEILQGNQPTVPVKLLCFIHLVFSFSLVVHEQDAPHRWKDLFCQAISYGAWLSREDRQAYIHVVNILWQPANMTQTEVVNLLRAKVASSGSAGPSRKGKEPERASSQRPSQDSLIFVAQYFLDELEYSVLQVADQRDIQTSGLSMQHIQDINLDARPDSPFALAVNFMLKLLAEQYPNAPEFCTILDDLLQRVNNNFISTARRLELELMHAGRMFLPPDAYFDTYITTVRSYIDSLASQVDMGASPRLIYYQHGVKLIENIIMENGQKGTSSTPSSSSLKQTLPTGTSLDNIDDVIGAMTPMHEFDFSTVINFDADPQVDFSCDMSDVNVNLYGLENPPQHLITPEASSSNGGPSTAATSPPSPALGSASGKVESNSCCEICGYRPKGDPRWFGGSMAKHKKLQHATSPPKIYRCPFPGCTSQYKNRPDNLRQHQIDKGHFMDDQGGNVRRPSKRKKTEQ